MQHIDAITHVIRRRQLELDKYRQDVRLMNTKWAQSVLASYLQEEANKSKAMSLGTNPEPVEWNEKMVFREMHGHKTLRILSWKGAKDILFMANYINVHWVTFSVDLDAWTITVFDCQREFVASPDETTHFTELMEVRTNISLVLFHLVIIDFCFFFYFY